MPDLNPIHPDVLTASADRPAEVSLGDEEIYCPFCNYNLTGVLSGRCPECGCDFHRQSLFEAQRANQITLIPWDDPQPTPLLQRFSRTLGVSLFDSKRFAFAFSVQPQKTLALQFSTIIFCVAWLSFIASAALCALMIQKFSRPPVVDNVADVLGIGILAACFITAALALLIPISACLLWILCPHYDGRAHFRPWLAICAYAGSHLILTPIAVPIVVFFSLWSGRGSELLLAYGAAMSVVVLCCGLLTVCTLQGVIERRTAPGQGTRVAVVVLFLLYGAMGLLGTGMCMWLALEVWELL